MNKKSFRFQRLLMTLLGLSMLLMVSGMAQASNQLPASDAPALVRIDLPNEAALQTLDIKILQVFARLYTQQGGMILLLPADKELQRQFSDQGYTLQVIEPQVEEDSYYLLYGLEPALVEAIKLFTGSILVQEGRQAVAKATPDQAQQITTLGIAVQPLRLHPLVVTQPIEQKALAGSAAASPLVQRMIDQVQTTTLYDSVGDLSGEWPVTIKGSPYTLSTRYTGNETASIKATRFAYEKFEAIGLPTGYHTYWVYGWERRNVLAQQTGLTQPERIFLLTAHLDSYSTNPMVYAPGADDNASGSAGVMAIADILSQYPFGCTLRYALFTGEELGMYGSAAYASYVYNQGENIEAVLNLDMIAYNTPGTKRSIELNTRPGNGGDLSIAYQFDSAVTNYQLGLTPYILQEGLSFSDHSSFWDNGYPAILAIEDWNDHTPSYHQVTDRLGTLDLDYYTRFTKAALATFAHMGCMLQGDLSGTVSDAASGDPIPNAAIQVAGVYGAPWTIYTLADGTYTLPLFQGNYDISITADSHLSDRSLNVPVTNNETTTQDFSLPTTTHQVFIPLVAAGVSH